MVAQTCLFSHDPAGITEDSLGNGPQRRWLRCGTAPLGRRSKPDIDPEGVAQHIQPFQGWYSQGVILQGRCPCLSYQSPSRISNCQNQLTSFCQPPLQFWK